MSKRPKAREYLDAVIVACWQRHKEAEPDISTERLMEMVRCDTGANVDRQIEALQLVGMLKRQ